MTDYLKALLLEQGGNDRTEDLTWREDGAETLVLPAGEEPENRPGMAAAGPDSSGEGHAGPQSWGVLSLRPAAGADGGRDGSGIRLSGGGQLDTAVYGPDGTEYLSFHETADGGPAREAPGSTAAWADGALRVSMTALTAPQGESRVISLRPPERGTEGWDPEALDRAFRRDARRFDGGVQLL